MKRTIERCIATPKELWSTCCGFVVFIAPILVISLMAVGPTPARAEDDVKPEPPKPEALNLEAAKLEEAKLQEARLQVEKVQEAKLQEAKLHEVWRVTLKKTRPKIGFFVATYPGKEWREVQPVEVPKLPMTPRRGARPFNVGNGNELSAQAPTGLISSATGTFDSVTGVTSETGQINASGAAVANAYSIQLNTNTFASTDCNGSSCQGWEQFVFENDGDSGPYHGVYIQYWLLGYGSTSPGAGWTEYETSGQWYKNSLGVPIPSQPISNLAKLSLTGTVSAGSDSYLFEAGTTMYAGTGLNAVNAAKGWTTAEFCIVGDANSGQANFNAGSTIVTKTTLVDGGTAAPTCVAVGFTGETNNLGFGPSAPGTSGPGPALFVKESSSGSEAASCSNATSIGDTHLTTFKGLLYDFQAAGDFVLVQVGQNFLVHTRQVSGKPAWPNASLNTAVATRMGKTNVVISVTPRFTLTIDGKNTELGDGKTTSTPDGVDVTRKGNVYYIRSESGDSVRATINASNSFNWIDVSVGLSNCCADATGLLAHPNENVKQIATRDGKLLTTPFVFQDLYAVHGESWRVPLNESLLPEDPHREIGTPAKPFSASDLDPKVYQRARAAAKAAGVKGGALLDAATLDIAVFGDEKAAHPFVGAHPPIALAKGVVALEFAGHYDGSYSVVGSTDDAGHGAMILDLQPDGHITGTGKNQVSGEAYKIEAMLDEDGVFKGEMIGPKDRFNLEGTAIKTKNERLGGTLLRFTSATKADGALDIDLAIAK